MEWFLNPGLLAGAGLAAVPVIVHLVMRQRPRQLEFPALRFIQKRHDTNRRSLKLRQLLLLALRVGVICLLAAALARPRIDASNMLGEAQGPVAAAFVFDTQPHMQYRHENETRLEVARERALWILARLPEESQVGVLDGRSDTPVFQVDLGAAKQRIDRLDTSSIARPVGQVLDSAVELLDKSDRRREVYVFTDLSRESWPRESSRAAARLAKLPGTSIYLVDVGVDEPQNFALGEPRLSSQVLARNTPLRISSDLVAVGSQGPKVVECYLLDSAGNPQKRGQQAVDASSAAVPVEFQIGRLGTGTQQGFLRIVGDDALPADDVRFFSAEVRAAWKLLLVAPAPAEQQAFFLSEALAPAAFRKNDEARFHCQTINYRQLASQKLEGFAAVYLLDPPPLADAVWQQLGTFAAAGGGIGIALGEQAVPDEMNRAAAQELLPGTLGTQARRPEGESLDSDAGSHPLLAKFAPLRGTIPWEAFPIFRYWQFDKLQPGVQTVMPLAGGQPVLLEKSLGSGRVLTLATPLSEPPSAASGDRWNLLPTGFEPWPFVMLANEMTMYLVGGTEESMNFLAGQPAVVHVDPQHYPTYQVTTPKDQFVQAPESGTNSLVVAATELAGNYRVKAGGDEGLDLGFSVNLPPQLTSVTRIDEPQLKELLGELKFHVARRPEQIEREVSTGRVGRELFPLLIALVALLLAAEHVLANRFYRTS